LLLSFDTYTHVLLLLPAAGEYTAERLKELQAATAKLPSKYKPPAAAAGGEDGSFKLSGSFKAAKKPNDDRFTYNYSIHGTVSTPGAAAAGGGGQQPVGTAGAVGNGSAAGQQQQEQMPLPPPPKRPGAAAGAGAGAGAGRAAAGAGGGVSGSESDDADDGFALPDEETIKWVKKGGWNSGLRVQGSGKGCMGLRTAAAVSLAWCLLSLPITSLPSPLYSCGCDWEKAAPS
jgi:hypothetical protein